MEQIINPNRNPGPGRPSLRIEVNLKNPQTSLDQIRLLCKNKKIKENTLLFAKSLLDLTEHVGNEQSSQTDSDLGDIFNDFIEQAPNEELLYMTSSLLTRLVNKDRLKLLMMSFSQLDYEEQCDFFAFQGHSLNQELYAASKEGDKNAYEINLEDLKTTTKSECTKHNQQ